MKKLIFYTLFLIMFVASGASAAHLKWDASVNADDDGMPQVHYRVYEGKSLDAMDAVAETDDLVYRIPDIVSFNTYYQVTAFNINGESPMSNYVIYTNKQIPITPGNVRIMEDDTLGYKGPYNYHKDGAWKGPPAWTGSRKKQIN